MKISEPVKEKLLHMHYGISGHSAVEICGWTKKHLKDEGSCYKRKFYGIDTNRCAEIAPTPVWCEHNCIYCWSPAELMSSKLDKDHMDPKEMVEGLVRERRRLLSGLKGFEGVNMEKFLDAYEKFPSHWAISLSGEPTYYNKLDELIKILKENKDVRSIFVVSNGQEPQVLEKLANKNLLPVQLYISVNAPNKFLYEKIARPSYKNGWERLNKTLFSLKNFNTRTVIRFTLIKGINDSEELLEEYSNLFEEAQVDFIEIKAYMFLGYSRKRLKNENMPTHEEVKTFAKTLEKKLPSYKIIDEYKPSRIVLLKNKNSRVDNIIIFNDPKYEKVDHINPKWKIYTLLKKYRKVRKILDDYHFNSWDKDYMTLEEQGKSLNVDMDKLMADINKFIHENYQK